MEDEIKSQGASNAGNNQNPSQENSQNIASSNSQNVEQSSRNKQLTDSRVESWPPSDNNNQIPNNNQGFSNNAPQFNQFPTQTKKGGVLKWVLIIIITFVALLIIGLLLFFFLYIPSRPEYKMAKMVENTLTNPAPQTSTTIKFNSKNSLLSDYNGGIIKLNSAMKDGKIQLGVKIGNIPNSFRYASSSGINTSDLGYFNLTSLKDVEATGIYADEQIYFKFSNTEKAIESLSLDDTESSASSTKDDQWYSYKLSNLVKDKDKLDLTTCILSKAGQPLFNKKDLNKYLKVQDFLSFSSQFVFSKEKINGQDMLVATLNQDRTENVDQTLENEKSIQIGKSLIKDSPIGNCLTDQQITDLVENGNDDDDNYNSSSDNSSKPVTKIYIDSNNQLKRTDISSKSLSILTDYNQDSVNIETPSGAKALDN